MAGLLCRHPYNRSSGILLQRLSNPAPLLGIINDIPDSPRSRPANWSQPKPTLKLAPMIDKHHRSYFWHAPIAAV